MVFGFFKSGYSKIKSALSKTRHFLGDKLFELFQKPLDEESLEEIEKLLYESDFGVKTSLELTEKIRKLHQQSPSLTATDYFDFLRQELLATLSSTSTELNFSEAQGVPFTILIIGVNGNGKTTSTAKLAHLFQTSGKKTLIAAADTFRAAAVEQLEIWAKETKVDIVKGKTGSDPASVAFDAVEAGKARHSDVVIIDTAGRLHNKVPLMQELAKIRRSCQKASKTGPHETLLVLDATTGQNAIEQAKQFHQFTPISGLILTKLDGTAKGGIVIAIQQELGIPVKFIGTGEGMEDLEPFNPKSFVESLFER